MKTIFKKSHLPFLKQVLHRGEGREYWNLVRTMQDENGLQHQLPAELALLRRGAADGDAWSMCELARNYFHHGGDLLLPEALRLWKLAILQDDGGARYDVENLPIMSRILAYRSFDGNGYTALEMQCALLAEWYLTGLGRHRWDTQSEGERQANCEALATAVCQLLGVAPVGLEYVPCLTFNGNTVDALAHWEGKISIRSELMSDLERIVELVFHELGHIAAFDILRGTENGNRLKALFGLSDERIASWGRNEMGYEVPTSEEDPDTLSYGVYTLWATFFLPPAHGSI